MIGGRVVGMSGESVLDETCSDSDGALTLSSIRASWYDGDGENIALLGHCSVTLRGIQQAGIIGGGGVSCTGAGR